MSNIACAFEEEILKSDAFPVTFYSSFFFFRSLPLSRFSLSLSCFGCWPFMCVLRCVFARPQDGSQGPAMGALRDDLEAFFGFCLAGQRFRPGADGGSLSALQLHRALRDCLAQGRPHAAPYFHEQPPPPGHGAAAEAAAGTLNDALVKLYGNKASLRGNDLNKVDEEPTTTQQKEKRKIHGGALPLLARV